jgi:NAD(P)-dependent dehydrogenase (short-subunit alcohol dehydrogenase family)
VNAVAQVVGKFKLINNAINIAGFGDPLVPLTVISDQGFSSVLDLNLIGLWLGWREEIKQMLEQEPLDGKYFRFVDSQRS